MLSFFSPLRFFASGLGLINQECSLETLLEAGMPTTGLSSAVVGRGRADFSAESLQKPSSARLSATIP